LKRKAQHKAQGQGITEIMVHEVRAKCKPDFRNGLAHRLFLQHNNRCNLHSVFRDVGSTGKGRHSMEERMGKSGGLYVFHKACHENRIVGVEE